MDSRTTVLQNQVERARDLCIDAANGKLHADRLFVQAVEMHKRALRALVEHTAAK